MDSFALFLRNTSGRQLPLSERLPDWQTKRFGLEGPEVPATRQRAWEKGSETTDARMRARAQISSFGFSCVSKFKDKRRKRMYKSFSMELAGRTLTVDVGRVAKQANGAAFMHYGDTTVLSTATASDKPRDGIDFFPLSVEYEEKMYAVGKIPGGFNKREGKASENAVLTARVIDRPMRPLFPKDYRNDVTLDNLVLSVDPECSPELTAMLGSAIATAISDIPFAGPCAMTQIGMIDGEFIVNPGQAQYKVSDLKLTVASTREKVIMIEAGANEIPEAKMIEAIYLAHEVNQQVIAFIDKIVAECGKEKHSYTSCAVPEELFAAIKEIVPPEEMEKAVFTDEKQVREENIRQQLPNNKHCAAYHDSRHYDVLVLLYYCRVYKLPQPRVVHYVFDKQRPRKQPRESESERCHNGIYCIAQNVFKHHGVFRKPFCARCCDKFKFGVVQEISAHNPHH